MCLYKKCLIYIGGGLILLLVLIRLFFPTYHIASNSMEPTINRGDYIIVSRFHYLFSKPQKNDIVLFEPIPGYFEFGPWTHRIIGLENDKIQIKDNVIFVNNKKTLFPKLNHADSEITVPADSVFQKGDNTSTIIGSIEKEKIIGKVLYWFHF